MFRTTALNGLCTALLAGSVLLAGCASLAPATPEETVRERATQRWAAQIARDWPTSYSYLVPGYRAAVDLDRYRSGFGTAASWVKAEVVSVKCEADTCQARIRVDFRAAVPMMASQPGRMLQVMSSHLNERWVREDGQWWLYQPH